MRRDAGSVSIRRAPRTRLAPAAARTRVWWLGGRDVRAPLPSFKIVVSVVLVSGEQLRVVRRGVAVSESAFPLANLAGPVRGCRRVGPAGASGPAGMHRRGRKESRHDDDD